MNPTSAEIASLHRRSVASGLFIVLIAVGFIPAGGFAASLYLFLACLTVVPLVCGPAIFRVVAACFLFYSLFAAYRDYKGEQKFDQDVHARLERHNHAKPSLALP